MHILLVTQQFPPEIGAAPKRMIEHCRVWIEHGCEVSVITSVPNSPYGRIFSGYKNRLFQSEVMEGVNVYRVLTYAAGKSDAMAKRALSFFFYPFMAVIGSLLIRKPNVIICSSPYLAGIAGFFIARFIYHFPYVFEMRDPWIEVLKAREDVSSRNLLLKLINNIERFTARHADRTVVVSDTMANIMQKSMNLEKKPEVISNGVDSSIFKAPAGESPIIGKYDVNGRMIAGFVGNLGNQYNLKPVVRAAGKFRDRVLFLFVGEGKQKERLRQMTREMRINNVVLEDAVSSKQVPAIISSCDMTILPLHRDPVFRCYIPLKLLESLALGRPVLLDAEGEAEKVLNDTGAGMVFDSGKPGDLENAIEELVKKKDYFTSKAREARRYIEKRFSRKILAERYMDLLKEVAAN